MKKLIGGIILSIVLVIGTGIAVGAGAEILTENKSETIENNITLAASKKEKLEIKNIITQSTDNFYLEPGTMAVEFTNGSYAYSNTDIEGNKTFCIDNGKEIIEFQDKEEFKAYIGFDKVLEVVTHENKEEAGFLIEEGEKAVIVLQDESYISVMENGEYNYYPAVKGNYDNSIVEVCNNMDDLEKVINKFVGGF